MQFDLKMSEMVNEKLALEEQLKDALSKNDNMAKDLKRLEEGRDSFDLIKASLEKVSRWSHGELHHRSTFLFH